MVLLVCEGNGSSVLARLIPKPDDLIGLQGRMDGWMLAAMLITESVHVFKVLIILVAGSGMAPRVHGDNDNTTTTRELTELLPAFQPPAGASVIIMLLDAPY